MEAVSSTVRAVSRPRNQELPHRIRLGISLLLVTGLTVVLMFIGRSYYPLGLAERAESPLHPMLRPSGAVGIRLGMAGVAGFLILALYPLRKRWRWLGMIGKTRHWLDFHALVGIAAPILITFHATFKFRGLAGVAYWIMVSVALSGIVGRYLYAQVPRRLNTTEINMNELAQQASELAEALEQQRLIPADVIAPLLRVPTPDEVRRMSLLGFLLRMARSDLQRPLRVARMRRQVLSGSQKWTTLGGLLDSGNPELEGVIATARRRSWLGTKIAFLHRVQKAFHLWHVIHRPFSISFAILVVVHIVVAVGLGYF